MKLKNVLVTGGAGYVGAVLVPKLLKKGYVVTVLDRYIFGDTLKHHANLIQINGDLCDKKRVKESLRGVDAVIHLASISNDPSFDLDPKLAKSINYDATKQLIDLSTVSSVKRFIYASSSSVYGIKKEKEVTEDLPLTPLTDYSRYKALCEGYLIKQQNENFTPVVLRPATVCGWSPRIRLDLTVNILAISALVNKKIIVHGGQQLRPNIHIQDMAQAYLEMLEYPKEKISGEIFNVGFQNYPIIELAHMVKNIFKDETISIETVPTDDTRSYHISSEKIKRVLRFTPKHTVEEAIIDIDRAYRKGLLKDALTNSRYYNIQRMKENMRTLSEVIVRSDY